MAAADRRAPANTTESRAAPCGYSTTAVRRRRWCRLVIEARALTDDVAPAAESLAPQRVADHGDARSAVHLVRGGERTAKHRLHAEHVEEVRVDHRSRQPVRLIGGRERDARRAKAGETGEAVMARAPVEKVRRVGAVETLSRQAIGAADQDEIAGARKRQRTQQHRVDHAEDGGVRADADGDRQDGEQRERRRATERAGGIAQILPQQVDHLVPRGAPHRSADTLAPSRSGVSSTGRPRPLIDT